jgi:hypothetical protein
MRWTMFSTKTLSFSYVNTHYYLGKTKINEMVVEICRIVKQKIVSRKWIGNLYFESGKCQESG